MISPFGFTGAIAESRASISMVGNKLCTEELALYCHNGLMASGMAHLLQSRSPSLPVVVAETSEEAIACADAGMKMVVVLSGNITSILAQFRTLLKLRSGHRQAAVTILYSDIAGALRSLLPCVRWLNLRLPTEQVVENLLLWRKEGWLSHQPGPLYREPGPLSSLSSRQYDILLRLARGQNVHEVAARLGISIKTVSSHRFDIKARLNISSHVGWLLLCTVLSDPALSATS